MSNPGPQEWSGGQFHRRNVSSIHLQAGRRVDPRGKSCLGYPVLSCVFMRMWVVNGLCVLFQRCCLSTNPYSSNPYSLNLQKPEESVHWLTAIRWMHRKNQGANSDFVIFWIEHFFLRWDFHGHLKNVLRERKNNNASEDVNARSNKAFVVSHISPLKSLCWSENVLSRKR